MRLLVICIALLTLWSKQCYSQPFSKIYISQKSASTFINDYINLGDTSFICTLNRACIDSYCQEIFSFEVDNSFVNSYLTQKELRFKPLLHNNESVWVSYTSIKENNQDSNYWNIDIFNDKLDLNQTFSYKSPEKSRGGNYGIYNYKNNDFLLYGVARPSNYPYFSPTIMIVNSKGEKIIPMTFFPYDTLNPQINNLEGVYMQHDTAFYFSYQIAKDPIYSQFYYKLKDDGTAILAYKTNNKSDTRRLKFFVDDDNNLISFRRGTSSKSVVVFKIDKQGNEQWNLKLPDQFPSQDHMGVGDIVPCKNGDILVATVAELFDTLQNGVVYQNPMIYLARLTKDGELKWFRRLSQRGTDGKWKNSSPNKTMEAENGDILIGGAINREDAIGGYDAWFMRLSANGCLSDDCKDEYVTEIGGDIITSSQDFDHVLEKSKELRAYPNPSFDKVSIDLTYSNDNLCHYEILDMQGRKLEQSTQRLDNHLLDINLGRYESGMYYILIKGDKSKEIYRVKVVKM